MIRRQFLAAANIDLDQTGAISGARRVSRFRVPDYLRERNKLVRSQLHRVCQVLVVDGSAKHSRETLRGTEQINILTDETCIN
jgi:hypothetical protein